MHIKKYKICIIHKNINNSIYFSHLKHDISSKLAITYHDNKYKIFENGTLHSKKIYIEWNSIQLQYRIKNIHQEPIYKAMGIKKKYFPNIIDATGGLGTDAFILASLGCQVLMLENNPVIAILLFDAITRNFKKIHKNNYYNVNTRLSLVYTSNHTFLKNTKIKPDVIYLDPMFPIKKKLQNLKKI